MSFVILSASCSRYDVNQSLIKGINEGGLGKPAISIASEYLSYRDKILSIVTEITFGGITMNAFHEAVHSSYYSTFKIETEFLFADEHYDAAVVMLMKCHELAQAHAYSIYLLQCEEHSVPQTGMDKTPQLKFDYKAGSFLDEIKLTDTEK
ncbi:hypothetical protein L0663_25875 [Dyadobacter sp. CY107]|uniref:hypothetical protein n=1 Tax=Dyadobacter fanqingshengii TaxID=2906443 RepID=UPI001F1F8A89|nr:hypothetical protein [Dyadobacter fanqingshengii]MCF2506845.1 hypothetical protein [Dyadobacter fanqingshengii]